MLFRSLKAKGEWWKDEELPRLTFSDGSELVTPPDQEASDWKMDVRSLAAAKALDDRWWHSEY